MSRVHQLVDRPGRAAVHAALTIAALLGQLVAAFAIGSSGGGDFPRWRA